MFPEKISVRKGEGHFNIAMGPMNAKMTPALTRRSSVNPTKQISERGINAHIAMSWPSILNALQGST